MDDNAKFSKLLKKQMLMLGAFEHGGKADRIGFVEMREKEFYSSHRDDADETLLKYARDTAHIAPASAVPGFVLLMTRFGPWYTRLRQRELSPEDRQRLLRDMRLLRQEDEFCRMHRGDSDEALLQLVRDRAEELGRVPKRSEMEGSTYIKQRLGPWPRVLEKAGLKEKESAEKSCQRQRNDAVRVKKSKTARRKKQAKRAAVKQGQPV